MPQVQKQIRKQRAAALREVGERQVKKFLATQINATRSVIIEKDDQGHTEHFAPVKLDRMMQPGQLVPVRINSADAGFLNATVLS